MAAGVKRRPQGCLRGMLGFESCQGQGCKAHRQAEANKARS